MGFPCSKKRLTLAALLLAGLLLCLFSPTARALRALPDALTLYEGQVCHMPLGLAALSSGDEKLVSCQGDGVSAGETGEGAVSVSLFGLIPLQKMEVQVKEKRVLIPGGQAVGVAMQMQGVMVVGVARDGGAQGRLRAGDVLLSLDGQPLASAEQLSRAVASGGGKSMTALVNRDGRSLTVPVTPVQDGEGYRLGVWVRSSTAGVGTLTYVDPKTGAYGALGHAVSDGDTGRLFTVARGRLMPAGIVDVRRGARGAPGELRGNFSMDATPLGGIAKNTVYGVYGRWTGKTESTLYPEGLPVGYRSSVHTGRATILSTVDEEGPRAYEAEIVQVSRQSEPSGKSFVIRVTDPALIRKTGGIVQGMSGSPVIQDGMLVGAVTHVFVDDPLRGYGLYIEWMLEESDVPAADSAA